MLFQCWPTIYEAGQTLKQHCVTVSWFTWAGHAIVIESLVYQYLCADPPSDYEV